MASQTVVSNQHGVKRKADDNLDGAQRLTKRFNLLNLGTPTTQISPFRV